MEVPILFHERNERYQMQCKLVGVPSTFGRHCTYNASQKSWNTNASFQGQNQALPPL